MSLTVYDTPQYYKSSEFKIIQHVSENETEKKRISSCLVFPQGRLPKEIILLIFSTFSPKELRKMMTVSQIWNSILNDEMIWKIIYLNKGGTESQKKEYQSWKEAYFGELYIDKYFGNPNDLLMPYTLPDCTKSIALKRKYLTNITGKIIKQIIKKHENLDCDIAQLILRNWKNDSNNPWVTIEDNAEISNLSTTMFVAIIGKTGKTLLTSPRKKIANHASTL